MSSAFHRFPAALLTIGTLFCGAAPAQTSRPVHAFSDEQLIDLLQRVDEYSISTNIIAIEQPLPKGLLMMQEREPPPAAVVDELVGRGPRCLRLLCEHVIDARKTRAKVNGFHGPPIYNAEYDRNPHTEPFPPGVVVDYLTDRDGLKIVGAPKGKAYPLAVGDLCFQIIGQIVNRNYQAGRYQPSGIVFVNSPVLCPDLAAAVRKQWGKATSDELRKSLVADVTQPDTAGRAEGGIIALQRYFPEAVPDAVRKRLTLPTYDPRRAQDFVEEALLTDPDAASREAKIRKFVADNGPGYREGMLVFLWGYRRAPQQGNWKIEPATLLKQMNGPIDEAHPPVRPAAELYWNENFIEALKGIHSEPVDAAVYAEFGRRSKQTSEQLTTDDEIALACATHLAHRGHDPELIAHCRRRLSVVQDKSPVQKVLDDLSPPAK